MDAKIFFKVFGLWESYIKGGISDTGRILESISFFLLIRKSDRDSWKRIVEIRFADEQLDFIREQALPRVFKHYEENDCFCSLFNRSVFQDMTPELCRETVAVIEDFFRLPEVVLSSDSRIYGEIFHALINRYEIKYSANVVFIPQHVHKFMARLVEIGLDERVFDPNCRTGGFLVKAYEQKLIELYGIEGKSEALGVDEDGFEVLSRIIEPSSELGEGEASLIEGWSNSKGNLRLAMLNLFFNGIEKPVLHEADFVMNKPVDKFDVVLTNPPFGLKMEDYYMNRIQSSRLEIQFIDRISGCLKDNGRAVVIVPENFLTNNEKAFKECRYLLLQENSLEAVISLPPGIFQHTNGKAAILYFQKLRNGMSYATEDVWFYELENDGYSLDHNRRRLKGNPLPDVVDLFRNRDKERNYDRTKNGFFVNMKELEENNFNLNYNRYRDFDYQKQDYEEPSKLLNEIEQQESDIMASLDDLKKKIEWEL